MRRDSWRCGRPGDSVIPLIRHRPGAPDAQTQTSMHRVAEPLAPVASALKARHLQLLLDDLHADRVVRGRAGDRHRLDAEPLAQHAHAAPGRHRIVGGEHHGGQSGADVLVLEDRLDAVGAERPSPSSNTMTSGCFAASSVSMVRVSAGPRLAGVVETIAEVGEDERVARAGVLHRQDVAPQRDARGLERVDDEAAMAHARDDGAQAAAVLPASMQVPASATTGTPCGVERAPRGRACADRRAPARRCARRDTGSAARRRARGSRTACPCPGSPSRRCRARRRC